MRASSAVIGLPCWFFVTLKIFFSSMADVALWLGPYKFVTLKNLTNQGAWATCTGVSRGSPTFRDSRCRQALRRPWKLEQNTLGQVSRQVSRALRQSCDKEGAFFWTSKRKKRDEMVSAAEMTNVAKQTMLSFL